jgi:flagellar hook protein FlgE
MVTDCREGSTEPVGTYDKAILPITVVNNGAVYGTFNFDLSNIQIVDILAEKQLSEETPAESGVSSGRPTSFSVSNDGVLTGVFSDGSVRPLYQLALATCAAPDKMTEKSGGFYIPTADSGELRVGVSGENGFGTIVSRALEDSTTDISKELAEAIKTQAAYAANAKVIGTISEMLDTLMRM